MKKRIVYKTDPETNLTKRIVESVVIELCKTCNGTGEIEHNGSIPCKSCHGIGFIEIDTSLNEKDNPRR